MSLSQKAYSQELVTGSNRWGVNKSCVARLHVAGYGVPPSMLNNTNGATAFGLSQLRELSSSSIAPASESRKLSVFRHPRLEVAENFQPNHYPLVPFCTAVAFSALRVAPKAVLLKLDGN